MTQGHWWFYGFTPPFRGVKPENQTQDYQSKNMVLNGKPTVGLEDQFDTRISVNKEANYYGT